MKRTLSLLLTLTALVLAAVLPTLAHAYAGAGAELGVINVKWLARTATSGVAQDTITLLSADTLRTEPISTAAWDWSAMYGQSATYNSTAIAKIAFYSTVAQTAANNVGDSLYFGIEASYDNGATFVQLSYQPAVPFGTYAGALGNCALAQTSRADVSPFLFEGVLIADRDGMANSVVPHNNLFGTPVFRLFVHGDISSTAQALGGCRIQILPYVPRIVQ